MAQLSYEKSEELTKEVLQASKAKDVFVSSLSHEIRNPLNALNGTIDYLLSSVSNLGHIVMLKNAKLSGEVLLNLANNVLDAAKLKAGKMDVSYTKGNFGDIIKKVFTINSESLRNKKITAEAFLDKNLPRVLWIDSSRLLQIMMNLISNALKFTPEEGKIKIIVRWCSEDQEREGLLTSSQNQDLRRSDIIENVVNTLSNENTMMPRNKGEFLSKEFEEFSVQECSIRRRNIDALNGSKIRMKDVFKNTQFSHTHQPWTIQSKELSISPGQLEPKKRFIKIEVSDSGCGIPEESISKLFEMFEQVHQDGNNRRGGTGLGLWICKQLCQKMDGDIKLYSRVGHGTNFVFYILVNNERRMSDLER